MALNIAIGVSSIYSAAAEIRTGGLCHDGNIEQMGQSVCGRLDAVSQLDHPNYRWLGKQSEPVQQVKSPTSQLTAANACIYVFVPAVPTLPKKRCQQTSDHAAATEAIQEPHHPGLQDSGPGTHQHGRGNC